jgi:thymidylate synthase ThyX
LDNGLYQPEWTGKQGGMKGHDNLSQEQKDTAWYLWRQTYAQTKVMVRDMELAGIAKEVTNRLLAPFEMTECIITTNMVGSLYSNVMGNSNDFFAQRISPHAQTEIRLLAEAMLEATKVTPHAVAVFHGEQTGLTKWQLTAKYARVSYTNFDKDMTPEEAESWCADRLLKHGHMSPLEHIAVPDYVLESGAGTPFVGWRTLRSMVGK